MVWFFRAHQTIPTGPGASQLELDVSFLGYCPGLVHCLDDGSEWYQVGYVKE